MQQWVWGERRGRAWEQKRKRGLSSLLRSTKGSSPLGVSCTHIFIYLLLTECTFRSTADGRHTALSGLPRRSPFLHTLLGIGAYLSRSGRCHTHKHGCSLSPVIANRSPTVHATCVTNDLPSVRDVSGLRSPSIASHQLVGCGTCCWRGVDRADQLKPACTSSTPSRPLTDATPPPVFAALSFSEIGRGRLLVVGTLRPDDPSR